MSANDTQVGGTHYQTEVQHWDMIEDHGIGYLEGCATKYLTRWRAKGQPAKDFGKARHYVEKLVEKAQSIGRLPRGEVPKDKFVDFVEANDCGLLESNAIHILVGTWRIAELATVLGYIDQLVRLEEEERYRER